MDIKSVITNHGYSINSLAKKMDVWQSALSTLVNGKNPTIGKLKEMATALDCSWLEFFKDEISIEDLRRSFPELMAQQADMAQPAASAEQQQAVSGDGGASDLPFGCGEPSAIGQQAIVCPHCHQALVFNIASYEQK
jgi:transcriptional regulator with XRE-family HTH domain